MYYSPLRYPGGKAKLAPFMELMMERLGHKKGIYIEPFAGGAAVAIELLEREIAGKIVINDYDKGVYSFWRSMLDETDRFVRDIENVPLTINEWDRQHYIYTNRGNKYSYDLGFATFYLNRTNRSGIIKGGMIGGREQSGSWTMDVRFNRQHLIERIEKIAEKKENIILYNKDIRSFVCNYLPKFQDNALVYFDPPYYNKGKQLYLNFFDHNDHVDIENLIRNSVLCDWILTYDDAFEIEKIYSSSKIYKFDLSYSATERRMANELMMFKNTISVPNEMELNEKNIKINLRSL